ncbi:MAG: T9SS type A sorting domain-containing protein [Bacteroidales bacterium]|nr:T9SS type A sorting domain-containing protein [Bacteroidales bacterium]
MKNFTKHLIILTILTWGFVSVSNAQIPEVEYTEIDNYYYSGSEIACTARVYSYGLIDQLCAIYYEIYKDDFNNPIESVGTYGSIEYTVRSQGDNYITQSIEDGTGYLSVKPLFTSYMAFTLGIFDNYCVSRNRPVALSMVFDVPGVYQFNAEIQSCTNSGSSTWTSFTANGAEGCDTESHDDYAAGSCDNPTTLFVEAITITICDENTIAFASGDTEYCPSEELNLVYNIGEYDDSVNMALLPLWVVPIIDENANTLTLTGTIPPYDTENPSISFDVQSLCTYNPDGCPGALVNQTITVTNAYTPVISGDNFVCNGGNITLTSDVEATWYVSDSEIAIIEQTAPDNEVLISALMAGEVIISCESPSNECMVMSEDFVFTVHPHYEQFIIDSICEGEVFEFGEDEFSTAGEYTQTLNSQFGCDSIVHLNLSVNETFNTEFSITEESYTWNEMLYTESGDYTETYTAINGCDSVVVLHLTIISDVLNQTEMSNQINVYPNPATSLIHIVIGNNNNNSEIYLDFTSISGKVLIPKHKLSNDNSLNIEGFSIGMYLLNIYVDDTLITTKLINKN